MIVYVRKTQIVPFLVFILIAVLLFTIFTVNLGRVAFHRVRSSVGADSGALAGASYVTLAMNNAVASSRMIWMNYCLEVAYLAIPLRVECQVPDPCFNTGGCALLGMWGPTSLPHCAAAVPAAIRKRYFQMLFFTVAQSLAVDSAEGQARLGFRIARANARQYAFQNAGVDDLQKYDEAGATAAAKAFTKSEADLTELAQGTSQRCHDYFYYHDEWKGAPLNKSEDEWQKANSRFSLLLDLWVDKNQDDTGESAGEGNPNAFNNFGELTFAWPYPQREMNTLSVTVSGDDFNGFDTMPAIMRSSVLAIKFVGQLFCWPTWHGCECVCGLLPQVQSFPLSLPAPVVWISNVSRFASGDRTPIIGVAVKRTEPEGLSLVFWKARYPEVNSSAVAEVYGGRVGGYGNDEYDSKLIDRH